MQLLWGMMNTLQVIVHMPMLNILFPANAEYFLTFLVDIVTFNIIPTEKIIDKITFLKAASA
jgi:hypothetical protein